MLYVETGLQANTMGLPLVMVAKGSSEEVSGKSMPTVAGSPVTVQLIRTNGTSAATVGSESASKQE